MSIQQFNATYAATEDRVLFRFNTSDSSEYRLWLTRKMTLALLNEAAKSMVAQIVTTPSASGQAAPMAPSPTTAKTIDTFQQEALKQHVDLKTEYRAANKLPLGADPVLITGVSIQTLEGGMIDLCLELATRMKLNLKQPVATLGSLRLLLQQMVETAGWAAPQAPAEAAALPAPGSTAVH